MLNVNEFKKRIKKWMDDNPFAQETDLVKYCKKIIPENELKANQSLNEISFHQPEDNTYKEYEITTDL